MARAKTIINMSRGDSYPIALNLSCRITPTTTVPFDLTGCSSALMTVNTLENPPDDTTQVFQLTGVLDADPTTGKVYFTPAATDTATVGLYYYDVQLTDAEGNVRTVAKSTFTISQDITK